MNKDKTSIEYWAGKSWKKAEEWLAYNAHMLAVGESSEGLQVARAVVGSGAEAGTAVLAAFLALKENGLPRFAMESVNIYKGIAKEALNDKRIGRKRAENLDWSVRNLEYYVAFLSGSMSCSEFVWPLEMPVEMWADMGRRSGMANVMMGISVMQLNESVNTEFLAGAQMSRFLHRRMEGRAA